ncbi:MAG TPA: methyl-accepting chemotaxis protein, partial [Caulobacteraceae bacterium]|nr:methyl-accepting chemotaxis protein [Caulobacteraceae bacterium]
MFVVLWAISTAISAGAIHGMGADAKNMRVAQAGVRHARDAILQISKTRQLLLELAQAKGEATKALEKKLDNAFAQVEPNLDTSGARVTPDQAKAHADTMLAFADYRTAASKFAVLIDSGAPAEAEDFLKTRIGPAYDRVQALEEKVSAGMRDNRDDGVKKLEDGAKQAFVNMTLFSLVGLVLVGGLAFFMVRQQISAPLAGITGAMNKLAAGDLEVQIGGEKRSDEVGALVRAFSTFRQALLEKRAAEAESAEQRRLADDQRLQHDAMRAAVTADQVAVVKALAGGLSRLAGGDLAFRLETPFPPSYEKLRQDFNEAMDQLQDAMTTISGAALGISAGADEVSRSAADLSQRTEQQAASLEETAAALDQITTAVRRTADGAAEVKQVAATASAAAAASSQVVRDTIAAISEIQQSARQVAQIIGVIDEIAFQTNLLALNAGVEAARA